MAHQSPPCRRLVAEALGTGLLVAAVVGSGIMATRLTDDTALQLLVNAVATAAALGVLIWMFGPVSGAHLNPAVTAIAVLRGDLSVGTGAGYVAVQVAGGLAGTALAHAMFEMPLWQTSQHSRSGAGQWLGELVATAGLILVVGVIARRDTARLAPVLVAAWIGAAYFFTSSTSFANPAVTVARAATDTFGGIAPADVVPFVLAQLVGAGVGAALCTYFLASSRATAPVPVPDR